MLSIFPTLIVVSLATYALALPQAQPVTTSSAPEATGNWADKYLYYCDTPEKNIEGLAWNDHYRIAKVANDWSPKGVWQPAMDLYMGKDCAKDPWASAIRYALNGHMYMHQLWDPRKTQPLVIYCNERLPNGTAGSPKDGKIHCGSGDYAYSWRLDGFFDYTYNTVFCPRFWKERELLDTIIANIKGGHADGTDPDVLVNSYASTYFHELNHHGPIVNETKFVYYDDPKTFTETYSPRAVENMATWFGCAGGRFPPVPNPWFFWVSSMYNPDSFSTFATVAFFQEELKQGSPAKPKLAQGDVANISSIYPSNTDEGIPYEDLRVATADLSFLPYDPRVDWTLSTTSENWPIDFTGTGGTEAPIPPPGKGGVPGCAYVIAANLKSGALCSADYCNCGGVVAPLIVTTISGSTSTDCAYTTQPASAQCPEATVTTAPDVQLSSTAPPPVATTAAPGADVCIDCPVAGAITEQDAGCPSDHPTFYYIDKKCSCCPTS